VGIVVAAGSVAAGAAAAAAQPAPRVFLVDPAIAARSHRAAQRTDLPEARRDAIAQLRTQATAALRGGPWSVMDKEGVPPSGDKHDYMSQAPYWWPDPSKPGGLPYLRRDGEVNPETRRFTDKKGFGNLADAVPVLALAWWVTGEPAYAERAALLLRTWFLAPATRMNPNLRFGQAVPGRTEGRGAGLIDTRQIPELLDAVGLLGDAPAWTKADQAGMEAWARDYLRWLHESPQGREEADAENNHGTYFATQVVALLLFTGDTAAAREAVAAAVQRLASQFEPDGRQPRELARTRPWHYSAFNLVAWSRLAELGARTGVPVWTKAPKPGAPPHVRQAIEYLLPFAVAERPWPHADLDPIRVETMAPALLAAADAYAEARYRALARGGADLPSRLRQLAGD
jgi:hypothetical protein